MHLSPQTLQKLLQLIRQWTGLALGPDKEYLIRHRIAPVVRSCGFAGYDELLLRLQAADAPRIRQAVIEAITTKETSFFRDAWLFEVLQRNVLSEVAVHLRHAQGGARTIRICSAGTSTGQEAYSLAIIAREFLDMTPRGTRELEIAITAVDISGEAIETARAGLYSKAEVERGLSEVRLKRFFRRDGDGWRVNEPVRKLAHFRTFNLMNPECALGGFDVILCRNVLIYFDAPARSRVHALLCAALRDGGWLALGSAESLHEKVTGLEPVKIDRALLYRKSAAG